MNNVLEPGRVNLSPQQNVTPNWRRNPVAKFFLGNAGMLTGLLILGALFALLSPAFLTTSNLLNVLLDSTPFLAPFSRLGKRRSAGITDLRYGNLVDEDWLGRDRFANGPDDRCLVAPTPGVRYFAVAATLGRRADSVATRLLGDGLVPLDSALGRHPSPARCNTFDEANTWIAYGMSHQDLLARPEVYERIALWLA